jgi:hypothetical protein
MSAPKNSTKKRKRATPAAAATPAAENLRDVNIPDWYNIREIHPLHFLSCLKPIYSVIEHEHRSKSSIDPFIKAVIVGSRRMTGDEWDEAERVRLAQKALEMKMGDFHEELMGKFPGYVTFPNGHETGCDVGSTDGRILIEVKNRDNTVKGSDGKHLVAMLKRHADEGKKAILVQVNCPGGKVNRFNADPSVDVWNGKQAYAFLSGREGFFDDLMTVVSYVFMTFDTYGDFKDYLEKPAVDYSDSSSE